jgi:hypothetical protein
MRDSPGKFPARYNRMAQMPAQLGKNADGVSTQTIEADRQVAAEVAARD